MAEPWPLALMLLLCGSPLLRAEPLYILVTPRVLRLGSPENVHVQAHSESRERLQGSFEVNLTVWDFPLRKTLLASSRVVLSATNDFMEQTPVTLPESLLFPRREKPGQRYVIIRADWKPTSVSSFMEKMVLVAPHAGYIFIQTDKTIYTPDHVVQYRVFAVNHKMDPVNRAIILDIKNPDGVTVISHSRQVINGVFDSSFHLPELVSLGTWTIEASYQSAGKQKFKATFDVKEYVLPSFEVQLTPNKTFFSLNDEALGVDIQARYIFNKPVDGHALAIFGLKVDNIRTTIQGSLQRVEVSEGQGHVSLQKDTLLAAFQDPEGNFSGASIFVNVTVFSSGGEMVQAETSGVKITRKAYNIKFTKTPQYFKPGMPFHFRVFVSNPDGSPAARVLVHCQNHKVYTSDNGIAALSVNTDAASSELTVLVETESPHPEQRASARMTAWPYSTQENSGNFLHIEVNTMGMDVGNSLQLSLNTRHANSATKDEITHFTIMVLSKGRVVSAKQQLKSSGSVYTSAIIDVTPEMLPSFRIVAFYLLPRGMSQNPELVADSIWIDVNDRCLGTLKVGLKRDGVIQPLEPQSQVELKVTGDAEARVWLLAVDKAVYALNSKHKLTQKKVWDVVEEHDVGCTAGSGKNNFAVFKDAGLDLKISTGMDTLASSDWRCPQSPPPSRRRRSLRRLEAKRDAVNKFKTELERKCCEAGLKENPAGLACEERTRHVLHGPACVTAFLDCCQLSETLTREAREERLLLGTTEDDDEFLDDIFLDDLPVRTLFPESWLWRMVTLPESASGTSHFLTLVSMPDSITTWEFMAVSLKAGRGLCVSDPFELTVMKSFFVDLKLPSSVVRNEQIQIQAVLYNFRSRQVKVRVEFPYKEPLCSASKPGAPSRQVVTVPPTSSKIVPFVLLPLELGEVEVEVKAVGPEARDHVKKTLLVRAGGQVQRLSHSFLLNPQGRTQTELVPRRELLNKVPDTEAEVFVSVQGDILGETIVGSLTPEETRKLLTVPTGCPEQTLSKLAPVIILTKYLDSTGQWGKVGVEHREQVLKNLVIGHTQMLKYRSADGIYRLIQNSPGSTWFTSYMFRIFALTYPIMTDKMPRLSDLCAMANWVITQRQAEDGHFLENGPVVMKSMQGGYKGSEADISLTALVLIALHSGQELCSPTMQNLDASIKRASNFLETKLPTIQTTFAIAIVSYALALANSPKANDRLDSFANYSHCGDCGEEAADKTYWPVGEPDEDSLYTTEATAYALMQKLQLGRFNETHAIANWLLEKRELGGGFKSTQTTVVAIEALTSFRKTVPFEGEQNLDVQISVPKRAVHVNWLINHNNAYQQRSAKFFGQDDLVITASGHGTGTISILTTYYKSPESWESPCTRYHLNVTLHSTPEANKKGEETFQLRMETRYLGAQDATMTIMEVSLLTGFYPNQEDLKQLTNNVEPYAFQYETKTSSSDSSVVLYLEKLSHQENTVLGFHIHQMLQADFLQAAMVTVYDYYEPSHRCSAFYNLPTEHSSLRKICHKDVCRCAEGQCAALRTDSSRLSKEELQEAACEAGVDFVYKIKLEGVEASATTPYVYYNMRLQAVIKSGTDPVIPNTLKKFVSHATCHDSLDLQEQESYLVMGQTSDLWKVKSDYTYVLGKDTFLMLWPADGDVRRRKLLAELEEFSEYLTTHGCQS